MKWWQTFRNLVVFVIEEAFGDKHVFVWKDHYKWKPFHVRASVLLLVSILEILQGI